MVNSIRKRYWIKQKIAFLLAVLMLISNNIIVLAEENNNNASSKGKPSIVEIPTDATKVLQEEFIGTEQPSAFTGAFTFDTE